MRTVSRYVAYWLSAASLGACAAFTSFQIQLAPDFSVLEWRIQAALLLVVGVSAGAIALRPALFSTSWPTLILVIGHVMAAIGTHEFLTSRISCVDLTHTIDYLVPNDSGALLLFGPSLTALVVSAAWRHLSSGRISCSRR
jgi:hypothetical protein